MTRTTLVVLCMAATAAARVPILLAHLDTWYPFELQSGSIAQALLDGLQLDTATLPIMAHIRGSAIFGYLLVPIFAVLGPTALALKLLPLLWQTATVGLAAWILDRWFCRAAAVAAGCILVLAAPMYAKLSVLGLGSHTESSLFVLLAFVPFLKITVDGRSARGWLFAFGLATGLAYTFHLQALLACLILAVLLAVAVPRRIFGPGALAIVAGLAVGSLPALLFAGTDLALLSHQLLGERSGGQVPLQSFSGLITSVSHKAWQLVSGGFVALLEFYETGPLAAVAGGLYALGLLTAGVIAVVLDRQRFAALFGHLIGRADRAVSPAALFVLHPLLLVGLFMLAEAKLNELELSSGLTNRRLVPMIFSLMLLAAIGIGQLAARRRTAARVLLAALCLPGALGLVGTSMQPATRRVPQRGECYEWFVAQLDHHAGGDPVVLVDTITRLDRGDARFATLRYDVRPGPPATLDRSTLDAGREPWATLRGRTALFLATAAGRDLGRKPPGRLASVDVAGFLDTLDAGQRTAFLHGVGLGVTGPRPAYPESYGPARAALGRTLAAFELADRILVAEGYGFVRGFAHDPYNVNMPRAVADMAAHSPPVRAALYRGLGWGYRQRYLEPPTEVPDGLAILDAIPEFDRPAFVEAFTGRVLPDEAEGSAR